MVTWILIADRGRARVFSRDLYLDKWSKVASFDFPEGRLREGETRTDRPSSISVGDGRSAPEPHSDFRHTTAANFSRELVDYLEKGRQAKAFDLLWILAPPLFLGELRDHLPNTLRSLVRREWPKDLTGHPDSQIPGELEQLVAQDDSP